MQSYSLFSLQKIQWKKEISLLITMLNSFSFNRQVYQNHLYHFRYHKDYANQSGRQLIHTRYMESKQQGTISVKTRDRFQVVEEVLRFQLSRLNAKDGAKPDVSLAHKSLTLNPSNAGTACKSHTKHHFQEGCWPQPGNQRQYITAN